MLILVRWRLAHVNHSEGASHRRDLLVKEFSTCEINFASQAGGFSVGFMLIIPFPREWIINAFRRSSVIQP
eukprot:2947593-Rhodomonas_salina.1